MTEQEYKALDKHVNNLIKYIRRQPNIIDCFADYKMEDCGYMVPRGVVVACNMETLNKLRSHAQRYYPDMHITEMGVATCIKRNIKRSLIREIIAKRNIY